MGQGEDFSVEVTSKNRSSSKIAAMLFISCLEHGKETFHRRLMERLKEKWIELELQDCVRERLSVWEPLPDLHGSLESTVLQEALSKSNGWARFT